MIRHLIILLVIGAACYGAVNWVYRQVDDGFAELSRPTPGRDDGDGGAGADVSSGGADDGIASDPERPVDIDVITKRNIFLPSSVGTAGSGDAGGLFSGGAPGEPDLLLIGTVLQSDGGNRAVLYDIEQKRQLLVKEGDVVSGVTITRIQPGKAAISRRGRSETLDQADAAAYRREQQSGSGVPGGHDGSGRFGSSGNPESQAGAAPAVPQTTGTVKGESEVGEPQDGEGRLQIDPATFGKESGGVIVKGRIDK